jgi:hypothetical protein
MSSITVTKNRIQKTGGVVILPIAEYNELTRRAVPEYYLTGKKAAALDKLVEEGLKEYRAGKAIKASSLKEALAVYGKNRKR